MKRLVFTKNRLIGFCICVLMPMAAMALGVLFLVKDVVLNVGVSVVYFLIPSLVAGLLAWCVFSNSKTWKKYVLSGIILVLFLITFFFSSISVGLKQLKRYEGNEAVQQYYSSVSERELMPDLSELGNPAKIEYYNLFSSFLIFSCETDGLICNYNQEDYVLQKARLDTAYKFQTEKTEDGFVPMVEIDGYQFQMLSIDEYNLYYPMEVVLIGYSDDTNEIVYLRFFDIDLDYITSLYDFITEECGWKYIR